MYYENILYMYMYTTMKNMYYENILYMYGAGTPCALLRCRYCRGCRCIAKDVGAPGSRLCVLATDSDGMTCSLPWVVRSPAGTHANCQFCEWCLGAHVLFDFICEFLHLTMVFAIVVVTPWWESR
eukprot:COSAG02_NODE_518_length_20798_cov_12.622301_6_plen_125_part_00